MRLKFTPLARSINFIVAVLLLVITVAPLLDQHAEALNGQVQSRFIQLSNSTPGGTSVTYNVSFKPTTTNTVGGMVVDFCADSPISFSGTCTFPTGFTLGTSVTMSGMAGFTVNTGWATTSSLQCGAAASNYQVAILTNTTPATPSGTSTAINFQLTGVTNTSTTGTFYARIYTFDTSAHTTSGYTCSSATTRQLTNASAGVLDYGGVALSTVTQISISATVQETLTFCVSGSAITGTCGSLTAPSLTIGNGSPAVLSSAQEYVTPAYTQLSTNANSGVVVRMKATNACTNGGLTTAPPDVAGGCSAIPGIGSTAITFTAGTADFGMCVAPGAGVTAVAPYLDSAHGCPTSYTSGTKYGMDGNNTTGTTSTYGGQIYTTSGAVSAISSSLTFAAESAATTPAGVYQGGEMLIATGTF